MAKNTKFVLITFIFLALFSISFATAYSYDNYQQNHEGKYWNNQNEDSNSIDEDYFDNLNYNFFTKIKSRFSWNNRQATQYSTYFEAHYGNNEYLYNRGYTQTYYNSDKKYSSSRGGRRSSSSSYSYNSDDDDDDYDDGDDCDEEKDYDDNCSDEYDDDDCDEYDDDCDGDNNHEDDECDNYDDDCDEEDCDDYDYDCDDEEEEEDCDDYTDNHSACNDNFADQHHTSDDNGEWHTNRLDHEAFGHDKNHGAS